MPTDRQRSSSSRSTSSLDRLARAGEIRSSPLPKLSSGSIAAAEQGLPQDPTARVPRNLISETPIRHPSEGGTDLLLGPRAVLSDRGETAAAATGSGGVTAAVVPASRPRATHSARWAMQRISPGRTAIPPAKGRSGIPRRGECQRKSTHFPSDRRSGRLHGRARRSVLRGEPL